MGQFSTYDHRTLRARLPVRSALFKQCTGGLVAGQETTSEFPLLYVFVCVFLLLQNFPCANVDMRSVRHMPKDLFDSCITGLVFHALRTPLLI
ncbi:hypothetical protein P153DRAFT_120434 [Dothidotthia symphoricarpi CBS 119687]|uniref:Uncharacterized protein n=1 Tax=Dothidotthia symphoricarpi CBS 119687 TaxID=1392245 RepID=A0A6A6A2G7_9PLEO|nr:hypothetical protein P153DRAFT_120434 [Dothidotthia symphoricarpi CBS 119687]